MNDNLINNWKEIKHPPVSSCNICKNYKHNKLEIKYYEHTDGHILSVCKDHNPFESGK